MVNQQVKNILHKIIIESRNGSCWHVIKRMLNKIMGKKNHEYTLMDCNSL